MVDIFSRRALIKTASIGGIGVLAGCDAVKFPGTSKDQSPGDAPPRPGQVAAGQAPTNGSFVYEIQRTEEDWRERLTPAEYDILRLGRTEPRNSHYLTLTNDIGTYHCKGCSLPVYDSAQKVILDIGWVFFKHSLQDSVLLGTDAGQIEAHCRRCASHLGHILYVETEVLHCINGTALDFVAA